ncbi:MAG: bifunctional UDP-N-acetylmuramoyl-tripeptide:D-alanyl-D-alanine ligase/alanine racemase [Prevotella sp.]|nr:bifunctional UDP-N-acetylmuramoyl-tripeptide:D-alanyl-D-alanine ligase/alanine racemase [Prevotella sp.]
MKYSIEKITTLLGAQRYGTREASVSFLLTDSRSLCFPEETLFFALKTERNDGHQYVAELYRRGVRNFVLSSLPSEAFDDANFLIVADTLKALQQLAASHRAAFHVPVVGITGSNGKTMVKEWLCQLLEFRRTRNEEREARTEDGGTRSEERGTITRSPRSYNSQIGVPLSVWLLNEQTDIGVFEAGISLKGEMQALRDIIRPTIAVLTNLGAAHQENFSSIGEKCREKLVLFRDAETIVYCADDETISREVDAANFKGEHLAWSKLRKDVAMFVESIEKKSTQTAVKYIFKDSENQSFTIPFVDDASIANAIICATVSLHLGLSPSQISERMPQLEPVAMRLEVKEGRNGCVLINDSYNLDYNSLDIALDFMQRRGASSEGFKQGKEWLENHCKTLILSDIQQSGLAPEQLYKDVSELVKKRGVAKFIGIGTELCQHSNLFDFPEKYFFKTTEQFVASSAFQSLRNEVILLKGARLFGFEKITDLLVEKVHETTLEVNLKAVVENLNHYRSQLKPDTKLVCMIKADAYGAGAVEIAKTLQDHRVDYLAVAVADEGVTLRKAGITANIMVMNPEMSSFKTLFDYYLEPEIYSFRLLEALVAAAEREGITGWPVHIKIDTGMHRLGFETGEIDTLVHRLKRQMAVMPRSVFSHFVGADSDSFNDFSAIQFQRFDEASRRLQAAFDHKILRHIANSAGIEHFPDRQLDMCRLGIGLYGVNPLAEENSLSTVSSLKTTILQLRRVPAGDSVGYSRKTILQRDSVIGAIPIGYADGLFRQLGNRRGYCIVNGQRADYVGNICMDVAMIDVTDIDCREGDSVEIFGQQLPVSVVSEQVGTIPYEILTAVSNRVKRVYFQE